ncbi:MAG: hypothetical protein RBQ87_01295 [Candidatus Cloacimonadaceae bacterium]|nr:hypothetical protein [Candidatus Cloacimonadaceae bacterium]
MLYQHAQKRMFEGYKIMAAMHGVKIDKAKNEPSRQVDVISAGDYDGRPEAVKNLTQVQKEAMTKKMMEQHKKVFVNGR